jgi:hypothetical protein
MNLVDASIERAERRLKKARENPNPTKLQSNLLSQEMQLKGLYEMRKAWREGKPFSMGIGASLASALGFRNIGYPTFIASFLSEVPRYREIVRNVGIPEHICEFLTLGNAAAIAGDIPPLSILVVEKEECCVSTYAQMALKEQFDVPIFAIDDPLEYNEESIKYVAEQLGEFIEFAESNVPGIKYDQDKHIELLEARRAATPYILKEWELRKRVPLPMSIGDSFNMPMGGGSGLGLEYLRMRIEEIEAMAAKGVSQEEKMRALWIWTAPLYVNFLGLLESRGVAIPHAVSGMTGFQNGRKGAVGDEKEFGRKLTPLEEEAKLQLGWSWRQYGREWEDEILFACQDLKCDAIIYYQFIACMLTANPAKLVADRAEKELGVPTFIIGGRAMDPMALPAAEFESRLNEFIDMVLAQKGQK